MTTISATPHELDLEITAGDGFSFTLRYATDVSARTFEAQIRSNAETVAFAVTRPSAEQVLFSLSAAQTTALASKSSWDLQQTLPGGEPRTLFTGTVTKKRQVTK